MKRWQLGILSSMAVVVAGCGPKQTEPAAHTETTPEKPLTQMDTPPSTADPYATDPYATDTMARPKDTAPPTGGKDTKLIAGKDAKGSRTHVVQKGDTLYSLARKYYSDQSKWKAIWEANKGSIPNKDKLTVGTTLVIP